MKRRSWTIVGAMIAVGLLAGIAPTVIAEVRGEVWEPAPPVDIEPERLAAEREARGDDGVFAFLAERTDGDGPVRYDPCAPIHVVVNDAEAPDGTEGLVDEALEIVTDATGLVLVNDGRTDERPEEEPLRRRGAEIPPVLIAWSNPDDHPDLEGATTGLGGSEFSRTGNWYDTGTIVLDGPQMAEYLDGSDGRDQVRAVILHELGHVVGLDHVDDFVELMFPDDRGGVTSFGPGDLRGLALLGAGDCRQY